MKKLLVALLCLTTLCAVPACHKKDKKAKKSHKVEKVHGKGKKAAGDHAERAMNNKY